MAHFCDRTWSASGDTYQAFVPTTLDAGLVFSTTVLEKFKVLDDQIKSVQMPGSNSLHHYFNRYIGGGNSLRDGRLISRKRLALVGARVPRNDADAQVLMTHSNALKQAVSIGCKDPIFSLQTLKNMCQTFKNDQDKAGRFRTTQGWIGGKSPLDAYYVCPPAELVEPILSKLCDFINRDDIPATLQAAIAHMQLLIVHPFSDGNGRMGRALVEVILRRKAIVTTITPPMFLYRLSLEENGYIAAIKDFEIEQYDKLFAYWWRANDWALTKVKQLAQLRQQFIDHSADKLNLAGLDNTPSLDKLVKCLFEQPIVTASLVKQWMSCSKHEAIALLNILGNSQIVKSYKLKQPSGYTIWDTPRVFELISVFDQQLFVTPQE